MHDIRVMHIDIYIEYTLACMRCMVTLRTSGSIDVRLNSKEGYTDHLVLPKMESIV